LELQEIVTTVVGCFARPAALDAIAGPAELAVRVAPDELLLIGDRVRPDELERELASLDPSGIVFDLSGGHAVWSVSGDAGADALARLSAVPRPTGPGVALGLVARVAAKVVVEADRLLIVVSSLVSHHLRARVLSACADLGPFELRPGPLQPLEEQVRA